MPAQLSCRCFFFQAEDGIRDTSVTGVQTCALPISLSAMLDLPESDVGRGLRGLQRRDMLVASTASAVAGETELAFRHQLLRDVAYRRLPRPARASLHRRAAAWFEEVSADGRHDQAAAVARHRVEALRLAES